MSNIISVIFGSPYVKTNKELIYSALKLAKIKKGEIFVDLGCGNGDVLIQAEKMGVNAIGYEISPYYYILAKLKTHSKKKIKIYFKNILDADLSKADIVYCYLLPKFLEKLSRKFQKEFKSGARLISIGFPLKISLKSARAELRDIFYIKNHKIYIYKF